MLFGRMVRGSFAFYFFTFSLFHFYMLSTTQTGL